MKLQHSLFTRRKFLNSLLGGWLAALATTFLYPIAKFLFPPEREPDEVQLPPGDFQNMEPNTVKIFSWGSKPGLLKKEEGCAYTAFVGVCTHLDCNITYLPDRRKFFCACHEGWYDEKGINIAGPPPRPLRRLQVVIDGENLIIKRESPA